MKPVSMIACAFLSIELLGGQTFAARNTIFLSGTWQLAKGSETTIPSTFSATVPVPGLVCDATGSAGTGTYWWYRTTFSLSEAAAPDAAILKIRKAKYGTRVYLNGTLVGDHLPCFTAGQLSVKSNLVHNGQNTLVVRVGEKSSLPRQVFDGADGEKHTWYPGIYDDVELILCNSPRVVTVQTAATLSNTVQIVASLKNETATAYSGTVNFSVMRVDNGGVVGTGGAAVSIPANGTVQATATITVTGAQYWTPEMPFLYELTTTTAGDVRKDRFGMRTFRFPSPSYWPELNSQRCLLVGTNVAPCRFEDDANHRLLWDTAWVRRLIKHFKYMNMNSMRSTIGFLPDFWYKVMDQEGFMVQDEFPIWGWAYSSGVYGSGKTVAELVLEGKEWLYERCNNPSLYCWDIANETGMNADDGTLICGPAIDSLRRYDIMNLPWDNSYGPRRRDGDICEVHPYLFSSSGSIRKLNIHSDDPLIVGAQNSQFRPAVNNEFEWIWLNRDNSATDGSFNFYQAMVDYRLYGSAGLGTGADRRHLYDMYMPAVVEFWRAGRKCQVIHQFCGLTSSLPNRVGFTSDNFLDPLSELRLSVEFSIYYRYAYAPVGICVGRYDDMYVAGSAENIKVKITNDTRNAWSKEVTLKIRRTADTATLASVRRTFSVNAWDTLAQQLPITMPAAAEKYFLIAEYNDGTENIQSVREFEIFNAFPLSLNKTTTASSTQNPTNMPPSKATDFDYWSRWQANGRGNGEWLKVDLGSVQQIGRIRVAWEAAYASDYSIQVSNDNTNWTTVRRVTPTSAGMQDFQNLSVSGRYVRVLCTTPGTVWNYSIIEFQVFGPPIVAILPAGSAPQSNAFDLQIRKVRCDRYAITYRLPHGADKAARIRIATINGRLVKRFTSRELNVGAEKTGVVTWSPSHPGMYLVTLETVAASRTITIISAR